jgi:NADH-quinone oxidoreductase subunit N
MMAHFIKSDGATTPFWVGFIFLMIGICFKLSLAPLHVWAPDIYQSAPLPVVTLLSSLSKIPVFVLLLCLLSGPFFSVIKTASWILGGLGLLSMCVGSIGGLFQKNLRRLLAYSTISHMGYCTLVFWSLDVQGVESLMSYLVVYAVTTLGIFGCLLMIKRQGQSIQKIEELKGISASHPFLAFAMGVFMFSLCGIPPLAGFFVKLDIFMAVIRGDFYNIAIFGIMMSVISAAYYLKIIRLMYFENSCESLPPLDKENSKETKILIILAVFANLFYIVRPEKLGGIFRKGAQFIMSAFGT